MINHNQVHQDQDDISLLHSAIASMVMMRIARVNMSLILREEVQEEEEEESSYPKSVKMRKILGGICIVRGDS